MKYKIDHNPCFPLIESHWYPVSLLSGSGDPMRVPCAVRTRLRPESRLPCPTPSAPPSNAQSPPISRPLVSAIWEQWRVVNSALRARDLTVISI